MPTIYESARGAGNITQQQIVVDMSNEITLLQPRVSPLTVLTKKLNTKTTHNYRFDWLEDDMMARWATVKTEANAGDTSVVLNTGEGALVAVNDLIKVASTGEILRVTAITGDTLTVTRAFGQTVAQTIPANAKVLVVANAMAQGTGAGAEKYNNTVPVYNYTQIIKTAYSITNTLDAMKLYGGKELARLRKKKGIEHAVSIENALLFGERKLDTTGSQPLTTTAGVLSFLSGTDNVVTLDTTTVTDPKLQKNALEDYIERVFTYGSDRKVWLCSPDVITFVNRMAFDKLQIIQADNDKTFGLDITAFRTPHGTLNMIHHPLLTQGYAGYSITLDMEELAYRPLTGRDTTLKTNIQLPDEDGQRDQYITEMGLELRQPKKHGMFILK